MEGVTELGNIRTCDFITHVILWHLKCFVDKSGLFGCSVSLCFGPPSARRNEVLGF